MKKIILPFIIASSLMGCASVPMGDPAEDARLKQFNNPSSDVAGLYIYRNEIIGGAIKMDVDIDGQLIGSTASKTYLYKEVAPGKHTVTSHAEKDHSIEIDAIKGKLHYIWQEVKMGLISARTRLSIMDEESGQKGVRESKLAITK